jgi:hypothetical protein
MGELFSLLLIVSWIASIGLGAAVAPESRMGLGALLGALYGPFGVLIAALLREKGNPQSPELSPAEKMAGQAPPPPTRPNPVRGNETELPGVYMPPPCRGEDR